MGVPVVRVAICLLAFAFALSAAQEIPGEVFDPSWDPILDFNLTDVEQALRSDHPHAYKTVVEIIKLYDYEAEVHTVETSDGYFLELHRIPGTRKNPSPEGKPVVFLQHGLVSSSADWVVAGPERGFAFILADAGYDVWMGNVRGSRYSRNHKQLSVNNAEYWSFSWHEIGTRDLPAMIDYVLAKTGREKLFYAGHSQGSTTFFVMASELPRYNDKIHAMFSLAPVAYCSRMFSPIFQALSRLLTPINLLTQLIGMHEFKPSDEFFKKFTSSLCKQSSLLQPLCTNVLFMIAGYNKDQLDMELLPAVLTHVPAGAGVNQFIHYAQIIRSGHFRQMDYGLKGNLVKYRRITPPAYNLKNVKVPVSLHYSSNDWLSHPEDVEELYTRLPNPIGKIRVTHDKFNHLDYIWGKDVKKLLYGKIMNIMARYKD